MTFNTCARALNRMINRFIKMDSKHLFLLAGAAAVQIMKILIIELFTDSDILRIYHYKLLIFEHNYNR